MLPSTLDKKIDYKKQVMFLLLRNIHSCYLLHPSSETWRPWVTQSPSHWKRDLFKRLKQIIQPTTPPSKKKRAQSWFSNWPGRFDWQIRASWKIWIGLWTGLDIFFQEGNFFPFWGWRGCIIFSSLLKRSRFQPFHGLVGTQKKQIMFLLIPNVPQKISR